MRRTMVRIPGAFALLMVWLGPAAALDTPNERVTLAGLTGVHVVVDEVGVEGERRGVSRAAIQADVEGWLRKAGLRVYTAGEAMASVGRPTLQIRIAVVQPRENSPMIVYSVDLTLRQQIRLVRNRAIESFAVTWSDNREVGAVDASRLSAVRDAIRAKVDQFIQAWQTVNHER